MASVCGIIGTSLLRRRNFLHKQIINTIRKCTTQEFSKQSDNLSNKFLETLSPLLDADDVSKDLCFRVRNEMISKHVISEETVDTRILDLCLKTNKLETARSYVKCLESNGYSLNIYALARYLFIYNMKDQLEESEENEIINIIERVQKECEQLPLFFIRNSIIALCKTSKWRMSLEYIKDPAIFKHDPSVITLSIIPAAFRNGEIEIGLTLLNEVDLQLTCHKHTSMYIEYLKYYLQNKPAELSMAIEKIFSFWEEHDVVPIKYIIDHFVNTCNKAGWETQYVSIKQNGNCYHCGKRLSALTVKEETFEKLAEHVVSKALIDKDIFQSTTPHELSKFEDFIHRRKPFDIVIDGLNVACGQQRTDFLKNAVEYFSRYDKKILIIVRQHMYKFIKWAMHRKNVYVYFLEDITKDDPYVLYATLQSGPNAKFLTIDLLRQHIYKLKDKKIQESFRRWQYTHQYSWFYNPLSRRFNLIDPLPYEPYAQYNEGYWHIPYRMDSEQNKLLYKPVYTWVCFRIPQK